MAHQGQQYTRPYEQNAQQMQNITPYAPQPPSYYPASTTVVIGGAAPYAPLPPRDHLAWSVINAILLCPILGIIAIIFSVMSRKSRDEGQVDEARGHGSTAYGLNVAGTVLGCIGWVIMLPVVIWYLVVVAAVESEY